MNRRNLLSTPVLSAIALSVGLSLLATQAVQAQENGTQPTQPATGRTFIAVATGGQMVPTVDTPAVALGRFILTQDAQLQYQIYATGLSSRVTSVQLRRGLAGKAPGDAIVSIPVNLMAPDTAAPGTGTGTGTGNGTGTTPGTGDGTDTGTGVSPTLGVGTTVAFLTGTVPFEMANEADLLAQGIFLSIATEQRPEGELRGPIVQVPPGVNFTFAAVGAPGTTPGTPDTGTPAQGGGTGGVGAG